MQSFQGMRSKQSYCKNEQDPNEILHISLPSAIGCMRREYLCSGCILSLPPSRVRQMLGGTCLFEPKTLRNAGKGGIFSLILLNLTWLDCYEFSISI